MSVNLNGSLHGVHGPKDDEKRHMAALSRHKTNMLAYGNRKYEAALAKIVPSYYKSRATTFDG